MASRLDYIADWDAFAFLAEFSARKLAALCGITPRHLRRYLRARFGISVQRRPEFLRLDRSAEFILQGWSVKAVAAELGWERPSNFCDAFKKRCAMSRGCSGLIPWRLTCSHSRRCGPMPMPAPGPFNHQLSDSEIRSRFEAVQATDSDLNGIPAVVEDVRLTSGGQGVRFLRAISNNVVVFSGCSNALILMNDLSNATHRAISYDAPGGHLQSVIIANNTLGRSNSFHVKLLEQDSSKYFLIRNTFWSNSASNTVPPFLDPKDANVHFYQ